MSEVIIARVYFGCGIVSTVDRLNNTTRVCATKYVRLVDHQHNASCTLPKLTVTLWQWDNQMSTKALSTFNIQRNPLDSIQNNPRNQVSVTRSQFAYPERITHSERLLSEWVAVTLSKQPMTVFDIVRFRLCYSCWLRLSSVFCALGAVCVSSFSPH